MICFPQNVAKRMHDDPFDSESVSLQRKQQIITERC